MKTTFIFSAEVPIFAAFLAFAACSSEDNHEAEPAVIGPSGEGGTQSQGDGSPATDSTFTETALSLDLSLKTVDVDAGDDAGAATANVLTVVAKDNGTPVITDLWLYTLDDAGNRTPLTGFSTTSPNRKAPRLMLPATVSNQPSGLTPADDGVLNGVMTNTTRGTFANGQFTKNISGTVDITLPSAPTSKILVIAGVEDQRYAGAAVINPDGSAGTAPAPDLQTHTRRSFQTEVLPLLTVQCASCHHPGGPDNAEWYLVTGTVDQLINDNFTIKEGTDDCQTANVGDDAAIATCIAGLDEAEFLVEPGAPGISDLLVRARPDEQGGTSPRGLVWYGSKGSRYSTKYGDRRMPSTTQSTNQASWTNQPIYFDLKPADYQILWDWVAQGAQP